MKHGFNDTNSGLCQNKAVMQLPLLTGTLPLPALPGTSGWQGTLDDFWRVVCQQALALASAGLDAICVENRMDALFRPMNAPLDALSVSVLTRAVLMAQKVSGLPVGLSVWPNHPAAAFEIASATDAAFIKVKLLAGTVQTPYGVLSGEPATFITALKLLAQASGGAHALPQLWIECPETEDAYFASSASLSGMSAILPDWPTARWLLRPGQMEARVAERCLKPAHPEQPRPLYGCVLAQMSDLEQLRGVLQQPQAGALFSGAERWFISEGFEKPADATRSGFKALDSVKLERWVQSVRQMHLALFSDGATGGSFDASAPMRYLPSASGLLSGPSGAGATGCPHSR
ncbi:MAG: BtpA/SgcQ family protein [Vampirovibrionales bacterium]|nr:BtpA/SgcQ family protein [Vampirovibrionales bacterium]